MVIILRKLMIILYISFYSVLQQFHQSRGGLYIRDPDGSDKSVRVPEILGAVCLHTPALYDFSEDRHQGVQRIVR